MQHPFSRLRLGSGANIFNKSQKRMLLHKNEDLEIVLGALLAYDKLAFPAVSSSKMTLMEAFSSFWCCQWMGKEAGYMYFSVVSDHIQYSVSQFWMANDNKKAIIVPVLAPDLLLPHVWLFAKFASVSVSDSSPGNILATGGLTNFQISFVQVYTTFLLRAAQNRQLWTKNGAVSSIHYIH